MLTPAITSLCRLSVISKSSPHSHQQPHPGYTAQFTLHKNGCKKLLTNLMPLRKIAEKSNSNTYTKITDALSCTFLDTTYCTQHRLHLSSKHLHIKKGYYKQIFTMLNKFILKLSCRPQSAPLPTPGYETSHSLR